ncbi:hypothetical protein CLOP_g7026, partial [Closterium sp. NIES-67]
LPLVTRASKSLVDNYSLPERFSPHYPPHTSAACSDEKLRSTITTTRIELQARNLQKIPMATTGVLREGGDAVTAFPAAAAAAGAAETLQQQQVTFTTPAAAAETVTASQEIVPAADTAQVPRVIRSASFPSILSFRLEQWPPASTTQQLDSHQQDQRKPQESAKTESRPLSPVSPHSFPGNGCVTLSNTVTTPTGQITAPAKPALSSDILEDVFQLLQRPEHAHVASAVCKEWRDVFENRTRDLSLVYGLRTARWEPCFRDVSNCSFVTGWHPGKQKLWILDDPILCMPQHVRFISANPWFTPALVSDLLFSQNFQHLDSGLVSPDGKQVAALIRRFPNLTSVSIPVTVTKSSGWDSFDDESLEEAISAIATCRSLRSCRIQIRFPTALNSNHFSLCNSILTERLAEIFASCPRLRSFHLQMDMTRFAAPDELPDLASAISSARSTSTSPENSQPGSIQVEATETPATASTHREQTPVLAESHSLVAPTHRLSHLSLPLHHHLTPSLLSSFPCLRSLQLHVACANESFFAISAPFSRLRMLQELRISFHADRRPSSETPPQARAPSLSPNLFSGLEHSLRKLTLNLRVGTRDFDGNLVFVPDITDPDTANSIRTDANTNRFRVTLPDSIWGLELLEELETDLSSSKAMQAAARRQERRARRVEFERRTALRVLGFNEAATAAAAGVPVATAAATAAATGAATAAATGAATAAGGSIMDEMPLDDPRFAGFKRLTSLTLTSDQWTAPPPSLTHLPNLTRLHMPLAAPSLSARPGVGLWHLKCLADLCISMENRADTGEQQQQPQQQQEGGLTHDRGQQGQEGQEVQGEAQNQQPFLPPALESLTLHGGSNNGQCGLSRWASSTITQLKLVNVRCPPVPDTECLFPNLRVFQAIHSTAQVGALPNLRHMLERAKPGSENRLVAHPNLTFLQVDQPSSKYSIPPMPKLEILIIDPLLASSRTLECLSSFTSLRFLRISIVGIKRKWTGKISCPPKLRTLEIYKSTFYCLPNSFASFNHIRKLRLIYCEQMKSLPEYLEGFNRLTELTIRGCKRD